MWVYSLYEQFLPFIRHFEFQLTMSYQNPYPQQPPPYGAAGQYNGPPAGAYNGPYGPPAGGYAPAGQYQPSYQQPQQTTV